MTDLELFMTQDRAVPDLLLSGDIFHGGHVSNDDRADKGPAGIE
jgi:hypothetical protein